MLFSSQTTFIVWEYFLFATAQLVVVSSLELVSLKGNSFQTLKALFCVSFLDSRYFLRSTIVFFINGRKLIKNASALFWLQLVRQWWTKSWSWRIDVVYSSSIESLFLVDVLWNRKNFVSPMKTNRKLWMRAVCINCVSHRERGKATQPRSCSCERNKSTWRHTAKWGGIEETLCSSTMKQKNLFCFIFNMLCLFYGH